MGKPGRLRKAETTTAPEYIGDGSGQIDHVPNRNIHRLHAGPGAYRSTDDLAVVRYLRIAALFTCHRLVVTAELRFRTAYSRFLPYQPKMARQPEAPRVRQTLTVDQDNAGWNIFTMAFASSSGGGGGGAAPWAVGVAYTVGELVTYQGHTYKCLQAHTSQAGWDPVDAPALWQLVS